MRRLKMTHSPCRDGGFDTSTKYVKILCFKHFSEHFVFTDKGVNYKNKELKKYIEVSVVAGIECLFSFDSDKSLIILYLTYIR